MPERHPDEVAAINEQLRIEGEVRRAVVFLISAEHGIPDPYEENVIPRPFRFQFESPEKDTCGELWEELVKKNERRRLLTELLKVLKQL